MASSTKVSFGALATKGALEFGDGYRTKAAELGEPGYPVLRVAQVLDGRIAPSGVVDHVRHEFRQKIRSKLSRTGDVVLTTKGTFGRRARVQANSEGMVYSPQVCYFRIPEPTELDPGYLYYWLGSKDFVRQAQARTGQTDMADYLSLRDLASIEVPLPIPGEQRAIAHILGTLDDKIDLNRRMAATLEEMARAVFREGIAEGAGKGWESLGLSRVAHFQNGLALQKFPLAGGDGLPAIKIAQLRIGTTEGADMVSAEIPIECRVFDGDVLFSWSGTLECRIWAGGQGALNQHLFKVTSERFPLWFYYLWIREHLPVFRGIAADKATTMGHINRHHLDTAEVLVPDAEAFARIDALLTPVLARAHAARLESRTLVEIRDTLLPKLVSGKVRVKDADNLVSRSL